MHYACAYTTHVHPCFLDLPFNNRACGHWLTECRPISDVRSSWPGPVPIIAADWSMLLSLSSSPRHRIYVMSCAYNVRAFNQWIKIIKKLPSDLLMWYRSLLVPYLSDDGRRAQESTWTLRQGTHITRTPTQCLAHCPRRLQLLSILSTTSAARCSSKRARGIELNQCGDRLIVACENLVICYCYLHTWFPCRQQLRCAIYVINLGLSRAGH